MIGEVLRIERDHYFGKQRVTAMKEGESVPLYSPNKLFPIVPEFYFKDLVVTDKGIRVIKTDAELDPQSKNPLRERFIKSGHGLSLETYLEDQINQNGRALSPTIFARDPLALLTGHRIVFRWRQASATQEAK